MQFFSYKNNNNISELFVESAAISSIAKQVGTPFYCYSKQAIIENYQQFVKSFALHHLTNYKICYAIKANANLHLVEILAGLGAGVDAVSAGEIFRALKAGIKPNKIVFAGVGKTAQDITFALQNQVNDFSVESIDEMFLLNEIATKLNKKVKFSLRVNPKVDANTHHKISTGRKNDKFGIDIDLAKEVYVMSSKLPALEIYGISTHIGSQIRPSSQILRSRATSSRRRLRFRWTSCGFVTPSTPFRTSPLTRSCATWPRLHWRGQRRC